jgi:hypothetical protein
LTTIQKLTVAIAELTKAHEGKEKDSGKVDIPMPTKAVATVATKEE